MKPPEFYRGREQTYIKHFFLEKYLERVAWNISSFRAIANRAITVLAVKGMRANPGSI